MDSTVPGRGAVGAREDGGRATGDAAADARLARQRRRLSQQVRASLRDVSIQLALLNHHVGGRLELKGTDLECLDLISRFGPLSPSALARQAGLHPATMTGILDRLERGGWISRARDPADRRAVAIQLERGRVAELLGLYEGMNSAMDDICSSYDEHDLQVVADFLSRTADAGRTASAALTASPPRTS